MIGDVFGHLCQRDPRHPRYAETFGWLEPGEVPSPRTECACDNCHSGRDALARALIESFRRNAIAQSAFSSIVDLPPDASIEQAHSLARSAIASLKGSMGTQPG